AKHGYGVPVPLPSSPMTLGMDRKTQDGWSVEAVPSDSTPLQAALRRRLVGGQFSGCQFSSRRLREDSLAAMALAQPRAANDSGAKLPDEFLGQAIKEVVMHEVGHSLGLRHNFKGSSMLPYEQVNDTNVTRIKGLTGSVMDYNPINIAPKGKKQGD